VFAEIRLPECLHDMEEIGAGSCFVQQFQTLAHEFRKQRGNAAVLDLDNRPLKFIVTWLVLIGPRVV
jgi:hypothetical protein